MGAYHCLPESFVLADRERDGLRHELELFENGGELVLRVWIGGRGADMPVDCLLTKAQAEQLAQGAEALAGRLGF